MLLGEDFVDLSADRPDKKEKKERFYLNWDALDALTDMYLVDDAANARRDSSKRS